MILSDFPRVNDRQSRTILTSQGPCTARFWTKGVNVEVCIAHVVRHGSPISVRYFCDDLISWWILRSFDSKFYLCWRRTRKCIPFHFDLELFLNLCCCISRHCTHFLKIRVSRMFRIFNCDNQVTFFRFIQRKEGNMISWLTFHSDACFIASRVVWLRSVRVWVQVPRSMQNVVAINIREETARFSHTKPKCVAGAIRHFHQFFVF